MDDSTNPGWFSENVPAEVIDNLFKFRLTLPNGAKIDVDMTADVEVCYEQLEEQMDRCPAQYIWWAAVYSEAKEAVAMLERRIKYRRGVLMDACVVEAGENKVRITDKQALQVVEKDKLLTELEVKLARAQKNAGKLWHMVKAFEMKSELLRSRAGFKRQEQQHQSNQ